MKLGDIKYGQCFLMEIDGKTKTFVKLCHEAGLDIDDDVDLVVDITDGKMFFAETFCSYAEVIPATITFRIEPGAIVTIPTNKGTI